MRITPEEANALAVLSNLVIECEAGLVDNYLEKMKKSKVYSLASTIIRIYRSKEKAVTDEEKLAEGYIEWAKIDKRNAEILSNRRIV